MALGPKWRKNGPKMVKKWDLGSFFYFFAIFGPFFSPFQAEGHFLFFGQFFPFLDFGPSSILYQAGSFRGTRRTLKGLKKHNPVKIWLNSSDPICVRPHLPGADLLSPKIPQEEDLRVKIGSTVCILGAL